MLEWGIELLGVSFARMMHNSIAEASWMSTVKTQMNVMPRDFSDENFLTEIVNTNSCAHFALGRCTESLRRNGQERLSILFKGYIKVNMKMWMFILKIPSIFLCYDQVFSMVFQMRFLELVSATCIKNNIFSCHWALLGSIVLERLKL